MAPEAEVQPNRPTGQIPWKLILIGAGGLLLFLFIFKNSKSSSSSSGVATVGQPGDNTSLTGMGMGEPITEFDLLNAIQDLQLAINNFKPGSTPGSSVMTTLGQPMNSLQPIDASQIGWSQPLAGSPSWSPNVSVPPGGTHFERSATGRLTGL